MPQPMLLQRIGLTPQRNLLTDVEHRSTYSLQHCELNVFETYRAAEQVALTFGDAVITSMVRGKKVMHLPGLHQFDYFPGETVLAPAGTRMEIDFPEAGEANPTQCIALTLEADCVRASIDYLNEKFPRESSGGWEFNYAQLHLRNNAALAEVINKLVAICRESALTKDILADLTLKELIVRLVQLQSLEPLEARPAGSGPLVWVRQYIRAHLGEKLDVEGLSRKACMSKPSFFRLFKREYGLSPMQFIIRERLRRAKELLGNTNEPVSVVGLESGFEDVTHFIRAFRQSEGLTPGAYRQRLQGRA